MKDNAADLIVLRESLLKKAASKSPPTEDETIRTIYATDDIRGDIVLAGKKTRLLYPITDSPEYRVHFKKTNLADPELNCRQEYYRHLQLYELWKDKDTQNGAIPIPRPLAYSTTTFRSELIFGLTLGALSPCKIPKGMHPKETGDWINILSPLQSISTQWQLDYWRGLERLATAINHMQSLEVAHNDLHKENMLLIPTANGYQPALIDFETLQLTPSREQKQGDYDALLHEALLLLAGPIGNQPDVQQSPLAKAARQFQHRFLSHYDCQCLEKVSTLLQTSSQQKIHTPPRSAPPLN